ncbi:hypothetical protein GDO81_006831 [Engystomops pustulosus]|uniref:RGS domain-containing protein n=1 Tax=Engystomops pustulosus TaxID=76066 RepID=A0AAV7D154_ENGPU|nr:hypothetical protein GDO81_006831 [Engystomops pustulosus]
MSFFRRKVKGKDQDKPDGKVFKELAPTPVHSPSRSPKKDALLEAAGPSHVAINAISANMDSYSSSRTAALRKQPIYMEATHFGDLGRSCLNYESQDAKSSLSKTLEQVLLDNVALPYFIQFMELRRMEHLVKFWLDAASFNSTTWSRIRAFSLNAVKHSTLAEPVSPSIKRPDETSPDAAQQDQDFSKVPQHTSRLKALGSTANQHRVSHFKTKQKMGSTPAVQPQLSTDQQSSKLNAPSRNSPTREGLDDTSHQLMKSKHFLEFLRSHHFCKYQIEVLTSGTVHLSDILFCESALFYFSEYMEKEDAVNILQFWLAADNFQSQLAAKSGQYDGQEAQNDAMILYDKYFSLQATHPLGFDDSVRMEIESNICREGGPLANCFTTPLRQAWTTMEKVRSLTQR